VTTNTMPAIFTRDLSIESKRKRQMPSAPVTRSASVSEGDANAALRYAQWLKAKTFRDELNAKGREAGLPPVPSSPCVHTFGQKIFERLFGKKFSISDTEYVSIVNRLVVLGARSK